MEIRQGRVSDLQVVAKIVEAAWQDVYEGYEAQLGEELFNVFYSNWKEKKSSSVCESIKAGKWRLFVTEKEGEVVGFITMRILMDENIGIIGNNAVHPSYQGLGIGSMQYDYILKVMKQEGIHYVKVVTGGDEAHTPARNAYEKVGFTIKIPSVTYFLKID